MDFTNKTDKATFYYSTDSTSWKVIGNTLQMSYDLAHFMGYRFALFNFATRSTGGIADFDWFQIGSSVNQMIDLYPDHQVSVKRTQLQESSSGIYRMYHSGMSDLTIQYQSSQSTRLSFYLFDTRGRRIDQVFNGFAHEGYNTINCRIPSLSNGYYYIIGISNNKPLCNRSIIVLKQ
jgi:hypothetical protein